MIFGTNCRGQQGMTGGLYWPKSAQIWLARRSFTAADAYLDDKSNTQRGTAAVVAARIITTAYLPTYVEWLTCLEMYRDVKSIETESQSQATSGSGGPPVGCPYRKPKALGEDERIG
jgi:hypothetical protein